MEFTQVVNRTQHVSRRRFTQGALAAGSLALLPGIAVAQATPAASPVASGAWPRTISHAMGDTVIPAQPQRVVAASDYIDLDYLLALGVAPVAYGFTNAWGSGAMPWQEAAADIPSFDVSVGDPDLEAIVGAAPDLILAMPSEQAVYDQLSAIAPTVILPWDAEWRTALTLAATALGLEDVAAEQIAATDTLIAEARETLAPVADLPFRFAFQYGDTVYVWGEETAGGRFFTELGLNFIGGDDPYLTSLSPEEVGLLADAEIILSTESDPEGIVAQEANPLFTGLPAVQRGGYDVLTVVEGRALSDLSPISIPWNLPGFIELYQRVANGEGRTVG